MHAYALEYLRASASKPNANIMDCGCGSGYLVACLAELNPTASIVGIDIVPELVELSQSNLMKQSKSYFENNRVSIRLESGWNQEKINFYDVIHVGAAAASLPEKLIAALRIGGQMIIPVGINDQKLLLVTKSMTGECEIKELMGVRYVPLVKEEE